MRQIGLLGGVALTLLVAAGAAHARCADDLKDLQTRIARAQKSKPTPPQAYAAAKILQKFNDSQSSDEVDCYNAVARARRALTAPPPEPQQAQQ